MNKNLSLAAVGLLAIIGVAFGGLAFFKQAPQPGSIGGDLAPNGYYSLNGVQMWSGIQGFMATSSSVCVFANPFPNATSSLVSFSAVISSSSPTGTGISVGQNQFDLSTTTAVGGYGSSTPAFIYGHVVAAGATGDTVWFTTNRFASTTVAANTLFSDRGPTLDGSSPFILTGTQKLSYRIASGTPATFTTYYVGRCSATIQKF